MTSSCSSGSSQSTSHQGLLEYLYEDGVIDKKHIKEKIKKEMFSSWYFSPSVDVGNEETRKIGEKDLKVRKIKIKNGKYDDIPCLYEKEKGTEAIDDFVIKKWFLGFDIFQLTNIELDSVFNATVISSLSNISEKEHRELDKLRETRYINEIYVSTFPFDPEICSPSLRSISLLETLSPIERKYKRVFFDLLVRKVDELKHALRECISITFYLPIKQQDYEENKQWIREIKIKSCKKYKVGKVLPSKTALIMPDEIKVKEEDK